jgi:hypothetical protein
MKVFTGIISLLAFHLVAIAQSSPEQLPRTIVEEGKKLYRLETTSWYGTDVFLENYSDREKLGGYFSYEETGISKCIFFSRSVTPVVIGTIVFDSSFGLLSSNLDEREFTPYEKEIFTLRTKALNIVNNDTLFKVYSNTNLNLIPLVSENEKKVYILTGPKENGVIIFGNDYLLTFDNHYELIEKKQLHRNISPIYFDEEEEKTSTESYHSHSEESGDFITPTDICTLMLYSKFAKMKQHTVISEKYLSIWNCETNEILIISKDEKEFKLPQVKFEKK